MTDIAARNRAIKSLLERSYGAGRVRVRAGRGSSAGWTYVTLVIERDRMMGMVRRVLLLVAESGIDLPRYDDDVFGPLPCIRVDLEPLQGAR